MRNSPCVGDAQQRRCPMRLSLFRDGLWTENGYRLRPMPDFRISPISIVNQIKGNLQDRYGYGYPILKELLQNA
ncbi:hypothetical protein ACC754_43505, partial [Rhizobium johnstonii]